jgi:hypothetical protein
MAHDADPRNDVAHDVTTWRNDARNGRPMMQFHLETPAKQRREKQT